MEPGPLNRLYLSVCSGIPSQVAWALARLALYTQQLGDRFQLADYPGLDEALVRLVRRLTLALQGAPRADWDDDVPDVTASNLRVDQGIGAPGENGGMDLAATHVAFARARAPEAAPAAFAPQQVARDAALLQHAAGAALVLRNVVLSAANAAQLTVEPGVLQVVYELAHATIEAPVPLRGGAWADVRGNALDILEALAPRIVLSEWVRVTYGQRTAPESRAAPTRTEDQVFAMLHTLLHTTRDRALLLASLRCLRAIAMNEANVPQLVDATPQLEPTQLGLTARCVALLPLTQDPELLEAAVDLLYQIAATGENALLLGTLTLADVCDAGYGAGLARRALHEADTAADERAPTDTSLARAVVAYLARNVDLGKTVWERDSAMSANTSAAWAAHVPSAARTRRERERERRLRKEHATPQERAKWKELTRDELERLRRLDEPVRGIEWCVCD